MLAALAEGESRISNWLAAGDTAATLGAMRALGAQIERHDATTLTISGGGLRPPERPLNLMNAGTGIRLLTGLVLTGADSDAGWQRPTAPPADAAHHQAAKLMGAAIESANGYCPLRIQPARLQGIAYDMPIASAQVKSAICLAGLRAAATTTVTQLVPPATIPSACCGAMGVDIVEEEPGKRITLQPSARLQPLNIAVPGDFSSAAFCWWRAYCCLIAI